MLAKFRTITLELGFVLIIGAFLYLFLSGDQLTTFLPALLYSPQLLDVKTLFFSILLEAIPFVLIGVFFSALLQTFVRDETVRNWTPKHPLIAIPFATLLGFIFPVCECAIVPIVRRLIHKGMPVYVGMIFLLAGPIINPVVMAATYTAFPTDPQMVLYRTLFAFIVAAVVGIVLFFTQKTTPLKLGSEYEITHEQQHLTRQASKLSTTFTHAVDEFFDMGKFLIFGALISAIIQVYVARDNLIAFADTPLYASLTMMGLGFIFSLCSEADAFIAASFSSTFSKGALLAFMVFGPMIDLKNTLLLVSVFRVGFVAKLISLVTLAVLLLTLFFPL
ncbi:permease [Brevibacillus laterosporus]|uniref:Permease n=1 Tax=Brevibacillus halotolerans TaxID=1507437 RepID=A0ABT4HUE3_9BACL|nr:MULTISPECIES: permease [Brevibacillus]MCR8984656.1 permease [Brevibacillus laterosporus]MCZ0830382.1 permease [Brevibacillus halotolerans]